MNSFGSKFKRYKKNKTKLKVLLRAPLSSSQSPPSWRQPILPAVCFLPEVCYTDTSKEASQFLFSFSFFCVNA